MEFMRVIISVLGEKGVIGEKLEQLGCIQYQRSDIGNQRTRQPTVQMSMADVQGYLRVTSGARMIDGWRRCSLTGASTGVAVYVSSVRVSKSERQDVLTFAVIYQSYRYILNRFTKAKIR